MAEDIKYTCVTPPDEEARRSARLRWDSLAKPLGSLGLLETVLEDIAALTGSPDISIENRAVIVLCADNGVTARGVTQTDSSVTAAVARQLALRRTSVCRMAEAARCDVVPVDMGIKDFPGLPGVLDRRIGNGTADFTMGPAMTRLQAETGIETGIRLVEDQKRLGRTLIASGEMGIGNTTTSTAVACVLLGAKPEVFTGRGAGLSDEGLRRKIEAIREGIERNAPDPGDPVDVIAKVGGFDIAGLCGLFLGGAIHRVPILIDGYISALSALLAVRLCPAASKAMIASHVSAEPASRILLDAVGKKPLITAGMRLGEGTGAVAAIPLLDMAVSVYRDAYTFSEGGIEPYTPQN